MFTFALVFFFLQVIEIFLFIFKRFPLFARKEEEGVWKKSFTAKTTDHNYYNSQAKRVKFIALLALQGTFYLFRKKMHFKVLKKTYEL